MHTETELDSHLDEIYASSYDDAYARLDISYEALAYKHYA